MSLALKIDTVTDDGRVRDLVAAFGGDVLAALEWSVTENRRLDHALGQAVQATSFGYSRGVVHGLRPTATPAVRPAALDL